MSLPFGPPENIKDSEALEWLRKLYLWVTSREGSAGINFIQSGAGAVTRTVQNKAREAVSPLDFGAVGDDSTDDTTAIQAALDEHLYVDFGGSAYTYKITDKLTLRTGHTIIGKFASIKQYTDNTEIFNAVAKSNISISGINFIGKGTDYSDSDSSKSVAIYGGTSGSNFIITNNKFEDFSYATLRAAAMSYIDFSHNIVVGPGLVGDLDAGDGRCYGVVLDAGCTFAKICGNDISATAQGVMINNVTDLVISGNVIHGIVGQHGMYIGYGVERCVVADNTVYDTYYQGIKVQSSTGDADNCFVSITGNTLSDIGDHGILVTHATPNTAQTEKNRVVTISGNTVENCGGAGINIQNTIGCSVTGNVVESPGKYGCFITASSELIIDGNVFANTGYDGLIDSAACDRVILSNNLFLDCGQETGTYHGILINTAGIWQIHNNIVTGGTLANSLYVVGGTFASMSIVDNEFNAGTYAIRFGSTDALRRFKGNYLNGSTGPAQSITGVPSVASASTITLSCAHDVHYITGTTGITSITAGGHQGHTVTLIFADEVTVTDGSNLKIAGNFTSSADDTLTLCCNGTNWYEIARSVN